MDKDLHEIVKRLYALVQRQGALLGALTSQLTATGIINGELLRKEEATMQTLLAEINELAAAPGTAASELKTKLEHLDKYVYNT